MNLDELTYDQEWTVTVKVLKEIKKNDELSEEFKSYIDCIIDSINTCLEFRKDETT
jgi:hypothetical protein